MRTAARRLLLLAALGALVAILAGCPVGRPNGQIAVYNTTDEPIEVRYRDDIIGQVGAGEGDVFNPRPVQNSYCLIAPMEILNADGQVIDQVDAGECYDHDIEVHVTDE